MVGVVGVVGAGVPQTTGGGSQAGGGVGAQSPPVFPVAVVPELLTESHAPVDILEVLVFVFLLAASEFVVLVPTGHSTPLVVDVFEVEFALALELATAPLTAEDVFRAAFEDAAPLFVVAETEAVFAEDTDLVADAFETADLLATAALPVDAFVAVDLAAVALLVDALLVDALPTVALIAVALLEAALPAVALLTVALLEAAFEAPLVVVPVVFEAESNCRGSNSSPKLSNRTSLVRFLCINRSSLLVP